MKKTFHYYQFWIFETLPNLVKTSPSIITVPKFYILHQPHLVVKLTIIIFDNGKKLDLQVVQ